MQQVLPFSGNADNSTQPSTIPPKKPSSMDSRGWTWQKYEVIMMTNKSILNTSDLKNYSNLSISFRLIFPPSLNKSLYTIMFLQDNNEKRNKPKVATTIPYIVKSCWLELNNSIVNAGPTIKFKCFGISASENSKGQEKSTKKKSNIYFILFI